MKKYDSCCIEMPNEPILKYNSGEKLLKALFSYTFDLECTLKVESYQNNPKKSYTEKEARHKPSGWSLYRKSPFDESEDCIEKFCEKLKEDAMEIINYQKSNIMPLTQEENNRYNEQKVCYICEEKFCMDKDDEDYINRKKV